MLGFMPMSPARIRSLLALAGVGLIRPLADSGLRPPHETGPSGAFG
jgi:hypothetical protein